MRYRKALSDGGKKSTGGFATSIRRPKIDYIDLIGALQDSHYKIRMLWGWPPMCVVYVDGPEEWDEERQLASISTREGAFKTWVKAIQVYNKEIDEFFQRVLGLDYFKLREDRIDENKEGHAPEDIRGIFEEWVNNGEMEDIIDYQGEECPIDVILEMLQNCTDIMPSSLCQNLELPQGSTYEQGVRKMNNED